MSFRSFIRDCLPPVLLKLVRKKETVRSAEKEKLYSSYAEAISNCPSQTPYESQELVKVIFEKTKRYIKELGSSVVVQVDSSLSYMLASIMLSFENGKSIRVLDFGGACGAHYFNCRKALPHTVKLQWIVVETPAMCAIARELENKELKFVVSMSDGLSLLKNIDLMLSSSAIQYTPDPRSFLMEMSSLGAQRMLLTRLSFTLGNKDVITIQRSQLSGNGIGPLPEGFSDRDIFYPHTNIAETDFLEIVSKNYRTAWKFDERSGIHPVNDEPITGYGILFEKNK